MIYNYVQSENKDKNDRYFKLPYLNTVINNTLLTADIIYAIFLVNLK